MSTRRRGERISSFLARLLAKRWDERVPDAAARDPDEVPGLRLGPTPTGRGQEHDAGPVAPRVADEESAPSSAVGRDVPADGEQPELTAPLTLDRVEETVTKVLGYGVQRREKDGHASLTGTWDSFPFVLEVPEGHEGWLLVAGDWEEPAAEGGRDELAASVNDWNRDKFFPTVAIIDGPGGPLVRAVYLADMSAGVTSAQLRLHIDTALSACTQALSQVRPLLPEL